MNVSIRQILTDQFALLSFRRFRPDLGRHYRAYLTYGLVVTWIAGVGRYWDNPKADWWQLAGLGSLAYVFVLAALLWAIVAPLRPPRWSYREILLFLTLTSLPAWIYATPVEMFLPLPTAKVINAWFLAIVATWRVVLLVLYLKRGAGLKGLNIAVATLLPLSLIVVVLGVLNLEHVVFNIMAGNGPTPQSPNDLAYVVIFLLTILSFYASPFLLIAYAVLVVKAKQSRERGEDNMKMP